MVKFTNDKFNLTYCRTVKEMISKCKVPSTKFHEHALGMPCGDDPAVWGILSHLVNKRTIILGRLLYCCCCCLVKVAFFVSAFRIDFVFAEFLRGQDRGKLERELLRRFNREESCSDRNDNHVRSLMNAIGSILTGS